MVSRVRRLHFKFRRRMTSLSQETYVKIHDTYHVFQWKAHLVDLCRYWIGPAMSVIVSVSKEYSDYSTT